MSQKTLTLQEVELRQSRIDQQHHEDRMALSTGHLEQSEAVRRTVYREFEQRWLEMEALLLESNTFTTSQ